MDRKKAVWPKWDFKRRPHETEQLKPRPRMTVTGGTAHGWCTAIHIAQETLSHGSNAYVEAIWSFLSLHFIHRREASMLSRMLHAAGLPISLTSEAEHASILSAVWRGVAAITQSARGVSTAVVLA